MRFPSMLISAVVIASFSPAIALAKAPVLTAAKPAGTMTAPATQSAPILEQLKLTDAQKLKLRGIRSAKTRKINALLSKEQQAKLQEQLKSGKKMSEALKSLGLKPDVMQKINAARQNAAEQIKAVLTPEQRKQLESYLKQKPSTAVE